MCQGSPSRAARGGGDSRPPWALPAGRTKEPCRLYVIPCTARKHTSPFHGEIILVKREESLYNGCGAVLLLCGRSCLLHRGVGCGDTLRPALIIRLAPILADSITGCKRFFAVWQLPSRFFVVQRVACYEVGALVARHGRGRGAYRRLGARRRIRWVPLHTIPRRGAGGGLPPCPRGNCVAFTPAGVGWLRTAQPPDVCRLV